MADVRETRQKLKILIVALLLFDVVTAAVFFSPVVGSERSRKDELARLWKEQQQKTREVEPLRSIGDKIRTARLQIDDFYKTRLPGQDSAISEALGKLATQSGVKIGDVKYKIKDPEPVGLRPIEIEADFSGDYLQLARFMNAVERAPLFFIIDSIQLGGEQAGVVRLQLKLETYLRTSAG
jgi:Tfp pilus assembly protein PilO